MAKKKSRAIIDVSVQSDQRGASNLGILTTILFLLAAIFVGFQSAPFYYSYYELKGLMQAQADKAGEFTDGQISENIRKAIKKLNIPVDSEELKINRYAGKVVIEIEYSEVLFIDFGGGYDYDLWEFEFKPRAESSL
jgi:hypothetical protein